MNYERASAYFKPVRFSLGPTIPLGSVGITLLVFFLIAKGVPTAIILLIPVQMLIMSGVFLWLSLYRYKCRKQNIVTDQEYDEIISDYLGGLPEQALRNIGIDGNEVAEREPILLGGYDYAGTLTVKEGEDGGLRSNIFQAAILFFSGTGIHWYSNRFYTTSPVVAENHEYFAYRDIATLLTPSSTVGALGKQIQVDSFGIVGEDGKRRTVPLAPGDRAKVDEIRAFVNRMKGSTQEGKVLLEKN